MSDLVALKHLRLDIVELADYDRIRPAPTQSTFFHGWDGDDYDASQAEDEAQDSMDRDHADDLQCEPILHVLPRSLETLWLDDRYGLQTAFHENLLRLAETAAADFPNLRRVTLEGAENVNAADVIQDAFGQKGIEFVKTHTPQMVC